ncbi:hypothetical protein TNCV_845331 [Trichonephila clavipes]|uniref:Uncharacterized protein n=1 Tax=Trichonephila clavipes TaxID=2585209 RepID=A0A8X6WH11_TRICX|nr:hypothetical protein TNCV_845331 [Trichonephila clavipes]
MRPAHQPLAKYGTNSDHPSVHYLVGRWRLADLEDKAQALDVKCQKCIDLLSNYLRYELEMCMSCIQWLPNPSIRNPLPTTNARRRCAVSSKSPNRHTAIRILHKKPRLVYKDDVVLLQFPPVRCTRVAAFLYAALSWEAEVMAIVVTVHAAENVAALY